MPDCVLCCMQPPSSKPAKDADYLANAATAYLLYEQAGKILPQDWAFRVSMGRLIHKMQAHYPSAVESLRAQDPTMHTSHDSNRMEIVVSQSDGKRDESATQMDAQVSHGHSGAAHGGSDQNASWVSQMLSLYSQACTLALEQAVTDNSGIIEPWYRLHTARLKLLLRIQSQLKQVFDAQGTEDALTAMINHGIELRKIARYCFKAENAESVWREHADVLTGTITVHNLQLLIARCDDQQHNLNKQLSACTEALISDACDAMHWCIKTFKEKTSGWYPFHRAHYQLAYAAMHTNQPGQAIEYLKGAVGSGTVRGVVKPFMIHMPQPLSSSMSRVAKSKPAKKAPKRHGRQQNRDSGRLDFHFWLYQWFSCNDICVKRQVASCHVEQPIFG